MANIFFVSGQNPGFHTKAEYLDYSMEKYDISPDEIFYVSISNASDNKENDTPLEKFSLLMFFKNDSITTIEDAANHSACPAPKLIKQANLEAIEKSMIKSKTAGHISFKNMGNNTSFKADKDELIAVLFYSYKFGNAGQQYIKQRKKLSENLGIKTIILSIDGYYIEDLVDISKNKISITNE